MLRSVLLFLFCLTATFGQQTLPLGLRFGQPVNQIKGLQDFEHGSELANRIFSDMFQPFLKRTKYIHVVFGPNDRKYFIGSIDGKLTTLIVDYAHYPDMDNALRVLNQKIGLIQVEHISQPFDNGFQTLDRYGYVSKTTVIFSYRAVSKQYDFVSSTCLIIYMQPDDPGAQPMIQKIRELQGKAIDQGRKDRTDY